MKKLSNEALFPSINGLDAELQYLKKNKNQPILSFIVSNSFISYPLFLLKFAKMNKARFNVAYNLYY